MMVCYNGASWIWWSWCAIGAIAFVGSILLLYVMQQCECDESCLRDAPWIRHVRRYGFMQSTLILCGLILAILYQLPPPLMILALIYTAIFQLVINAVAMRLRPVDQEHHVSNSNPVNPIRRW